MANSLKRNHALQPERFCKYIHRYCNQTRLDGFDYCIRHILEDKSAPFRQCMFQNQANKKRCSNAAPKSDKNEKREHVLCPFHVKQTSIKTRHPTSRRPPEVKGPVAVFRYLEHHCTDSRHDPSYTREAGEAEKYHYAPCVGGRPSSLEEIEASYDKELPIAEKTFMENIDDDFSWVEKPSDPLEHAGVYSHKEILSIAREKTLYLQNTYINELRIIYHQLKEKRRQFLNSIAEPPADETELAQPSTSSPVDPELLEALKKYHRCTGVEKILRQRFEEKSAVKKSKIKQCVYEDNGSKCTNPALVQTDYCKNHVLSDKSQVLFKPCGYGRNCQRPVIPYIEKAACDQHFHLALGKSNITEAVQPLPVTELPLEPEHFQSMDDIASLGLDAITPGLLFGLDRFGEPGESTDTVMSEDLMQIQPITLNPPTDILSDSRRSESE